MLNRTRYQRFKGAQYRPAGWLRRQLRIQADGLSGNLDQVWPDVRDSKWIGGDRDGWERMPYWLDGVVPLAFLLEDEQLIARIRKHMDTIIARQEEDGWLCPCALEERNSYDLWSGILMAKVLAQYGDYVNDPRVEEALYRYLKNLWSFSHHITLQNWAAMRWFEALIPIFWMYERRPEDWLLRLASRLHQQGFNYRALFSPFRHQEPERIWSYDTHVVNLAMALKHDALLSRINGGNADGFAEDMLQQLLDHHGMAMGHFTGDECLSGDSPIQGTELCGVVEAMYSYENLLLIGGNPYWGDMLEKLAFNALPATLSRDMWTHQYDQMTNQIRCARLPEGNVIFGTNGPESHLFGLEPNFGCCTANFSQGWPKLAQHSFLHNEECIISAVLVPGEVSTSMFGSPVRCRLDTEYPFRDSLVYTIETDRPTAFGLSIRIPGFVRGALVDGKPAVPGQFYTFWRTWQGKEKVEVKLDFAAELVRRPRDLYALWRGPLLYSVAIEERWDKKEYTHKGVERKHPYCDYEVHPESAWNYGFASDEMKVREHPVTDQPFSSNPAPVEMTAKLAPVDWPEQHGVCAKQPGSFKAAGEVREVRMIPYGCTALRMTEMPKVDDY